MDGECGHARHINLCAKPPTKEPTNSIVRGALSSATGKSHRRGAGTSSAPGAPAHPAPGASAEKPPWLPLPEGPAAPLRPPRLPPADKQSGSLGRDKSGPGEAPTTFPFHEREE